MTRTVLDCLVESLRGRSAVPDGHATPVAILWPDPKEEWRGLLSILRAAAPELLVLGDYDPGAGTGPAIWLRCVVDGTLPVPGGHRTNGLVPVLYLPGVKRDDLRAGPNCPDQVKPLVELMYRGTLWQNPHGRPWTPAAFLKSDKGLGLEIASDVQTRQALAGALEEVAELPVAQSQGRRWDADDFDRLLAEDIERDVLKWMADADATRSRWDAGRQKAFRSRCRNELDLDPETDADVIAGVKLARGTGGWTAVWNRFAEAPNIHPGVVELLRRSRPSGEIALEPDRWPDLNDEAEKTARQALAKIPALPPAEAQDAVATLEREHGPRREWLWASLDQSPVAQVLEPLACLADATRAPIGGNSPSAAAETYANGGWQADAAAREALACATHQDEKLVAKVVRHLLEPWMEATARTFQSSWERPPLPDRVGDPPAEDECVVFVDGLRYETGRRLADRLQAKGCTAQVRQRWAALPTVTATAKPAVTPVADQVSGGVLGPDFRPTLSADAEPRPADAARLRDAIAARGWQVFGGEGPQMPGRADAQGWMETGKIDKLGHDHVRDASAFARAVEDELDRLARRIAGLLELDWRSVRVVTDHGWLWLPGGLPIVALPKHLTASKWARCAVVSGDSQAGDALRFPWHWNVGQWFATPPGIACFSKRDAYAHGGVSLQECLIPDIRVERAAGAGQAGPTAAIQSITWRRLRCFAEVEATGGLVTADLRLGGPSGPSVAATAKPVEEDGSVSLVLADDEHEGAALALVVLDNDGRVLANQSTRPGAAS